MRLRYGFAFILATSIVVVIFAVMAAAYGLGALAEGWYRGASHLTSMLMLLLVMVMGIATILTLAERKWSALMQDRVGPNRVRLPIPGLRDRALGGLPHIVTDVLKVLTKEAFQPERANKLLFALGPILAFAPAFALFAIVPAGPTLEVAGRQVLMVAANPDFGLLYMFGIASLAVYGTSLAGWSSNNKFALLGGVRASSQMISYEVGLGLSLVGMMMAFSTVQLAGPHGMSELQGHYLWRTELWGWLDVGLPQWGILLQPTGFVLFFAAAFAETKRAPFDTPEGESEIVGYFIEYSGMQFGMFMVAEFVEVVFLAGVLTAVFFGGWYLPFGNLALERALAGQPWLLGAVYGTVFWLKVLLLIYLQMAIRWTFPRFRYDQIQKLGWQMLLPVGLVNVFVSGALVLWDPSLKLLAFAGLAQILVITFLTVTPPRQVRKELAAREAHGDASAAHDPPDPHGASPTHHRITDAHGALGEAP